MFPFDLEEDEIMPEVSEETEKEEYEINLETGKLTGRKISGIEAIKQWVCIALSIDRYRYPQYSWQYGNELYALIGKHYDEEYIESEARRIIGETVMQHEAVTGIKDLQCTVEKDTLTVSFTIETIYGESEVITSV